MSQNESYRQLTIFLLCHDRPEDTRRAVASILAQSDTAFDFIISDNSSNDLVQEMMRIEFPNVRYIRRNPMLASIEHFNLCIAEAETEYFCLFHDDDLLSSDFVSQMKVEIAKNPHAVAYGCNAYINRFGALSKRLSFGLVNPVEWFKNPRALANRYFARSQSGIAPFPGYVYNQVRVGEERIPASGGKYADVTWLLNLLKKNPIAWIDKPLMTYCLHESNDGNIESRRDRLSFLAYLKRNVATIGSEILDDYRCSFIYKKILDSVGSHSRVRTQLAKRFLWNYRWHRYARISTYLFLFERVQIKLKGAQ
jgi:glycosyltransferase involved in cell wall biosynthesis